MTVLDILIKSLGLTPDGKAVVGEVQFLVKDCSGNTSRFTVSCRCQTSRRIPPDALLIGDAIRQLRRAPEVRCGDVRLEFAKSLKPLASARAA